MKQHDAMPFFPVTDWAIEPVRGYDSIAVRLDYFSPPLESMAESHQGLHLVLTPEQALGIAHDLIKSVKNLGIEVGLVRA